MTIQSDLMAALQADTALMALLTGGLYTDTTIDRQSTPSAFNSDKEVLPCGLLRTTSDTPIPPYLRGARTYVSIFLYQRIGYSTIRAAATRLFDLLHEKRVGAGVWAVVSVGDLDNQVDQALNASLIICGYEITRMK
jgi:hypothetical protein